MPALSGPHFETICVGGGPAGLTAAYLLAKAGRGVLVLEADARYLGGISRTETYKGYHFDIGGHRFFSKSEAVEALWTELLGDELRDRPRSSRIYYRGKFFSYPLKPFEALAKLGVVEAARCVGSFLAAKAFPRRDARSLEDWVVNQFGARLYRLFFKTYTEKVWGMPCAAISADWAAQRIKGLSLASAVLSALVPQRLRARKHRVKSLIETFRYPRRGPGQLWEAAGAKIRALGGRIEQGHEVTGLAFDAATRRWTVRARRADGAELAFTADHVVSSAPLSAVIRGLEPPAATRPEAAALGYRDFLTVALIVKEPALFADNWIYIHEPGVAVGRIQNFKAWSPDMVPDPGTNCFGLEYFCFEGDGLWTKTDADLVAFAAKELLALGLARPGDVLDGYVVRQPKAYPVYDDAYEARVAAIRAELTARYPGLHPVGRNGMHRYNNQDHAMMTAMLTVENILAGAPRFDVWRVNQDAEYHEEGAATDGAATGGAATSGASGERTVPRRVA